MVAEYVHTRRACPAYNRAGACRRCYRAKGAGCGSAGEHGRYGADCVGSGYREGQGTDVGPVLAHEASRGPSPDEARDIRRAAGLRDVRRCVAGDAGSSAPKPVRVLAEILSARVVAVIRGRAVECVVVRIDVGGIPRLRRVERGEPAVHAFHLRQERVFRDRVHVRAVERRTVERGLPSPGVVPRIQIRDGLSRISLNGVRLRSRGLRRRDRGARVATF